jgi:murein DD-endopeptidase MepM/ murein hydrolase activator NlpD
MMMPRLPSAARVPLAALLCAGAALAAMPAVARGERPSADLQWQALAVAPISAGGRTGIRMVATDAVEPIDVAPQRQSVELTMILGEGDNLRSLLTRAGASYGDAGAAGALIAQVPPVGTRVGLVLGAKSPAGTRPLQKLSLRAAFGLDLEVVRGPAGALEVIRHEIPVDTTPLRVRGRVGDGLYWSLRAAGVSPQSAAEYLQALATEIDVGSEVGANDRFDLVIASRRSANGERQLGPLLYAGIDRSAERDLQLVKWSSGWLDAANLDRPVAAPMQWPVAGHITSGFGWRRHPILGFARLHKGVDFGASWGSPIYAAADGQVVGAGWSGGYGRQVRIAHGGGIATSYSHMSQVVAAEGSFVHRGQLIGYVGSSGLSTGPHLHYEIYRNGTPVNPLSVRFAGTARVDGGQMAAVKARLKSLLSVGVKRG